LKFILSGKKNALSDEEIILRFKKDNDARWIDMLFDRFSHLAFAVAFNYLKDEDEAKDVVMDTFHALHNDLKKYEIRQFHSWLHKVLRNRCLRIISKKFDKVEIDPDYGVINEAEDPLLEKYLEHLSDAIDKLDDEQRICIKLFYFEKKSYKEITDQTSYDLNKVKSYIQNGKRNLKIILERHHHE
jgi:RNA polymerase sigma factor (sigma-70 family)